MGCDLAKLVHQIGQRLCHPGSANRKDVQSFRHDLACRTGDVIRLKRTLSGVAITGDGAPPEGCGHTREGPLSARAEAEGRLIPVYCHNDRSSQHFDLVDAKTWKADKSSDKLIGPPAGMISGSFHESVKETQPLSKTEDPKRGNILAQASLYSAGLPLG